MSDDDLPAVLTEESLRNPHADEWKPMTGPFHWERRTESRSVAWMDQQGSHEGIAVRDTENSHTEFICSTVYAPDLERMR